MCRSPLENIPPEFVPASPAVPSMSGLSYCDGLLDRRQVAIQLLFCKMQLLEFVQNSKQNPRVIFM